MSLCKAVRPPAGDAFKVHESVCGEHHTHTRPECSERLVNRGSSGEGALAWESGLFLFSHFIPYYTRMTPTGEGSSSHADDVCLEWSWVK